MEKNMGQFSKKWEDLNFSDNYIFCKVMRNESLCKEMLQILLDLKVEKINYIETEKQIENLYDAKGIRMDVFIQDSDRVIDLEMQTGDYEDLILRSRYYQSAADVSTVPRRTKYKDLKENYIVFLCKEDPFGKGLPVYTKKSIFAETDAIPYNDKCHNIFYNSSGYAKVKDNELRNVLRFIHELKADSNFTKRLESSVDEAKSRGIMRDEYMYFQDILEEEKEEVREIGLAEGRAQGLAEGLAQGHAEGHAEGRAQGLAEGHAEGSKDIAAKMIKKGYDLKEISELTGLALDEIEKLQNI